MDRSGTLKNVIIYCRESRDDGLEHYSRIETQRDILVDFCQKQQLGNIIEIIMDDNKSGTNFERLRAVKEKAARKEVEILLCKDASRLGRNILESLAFAEFLANHQVALIFESERYDEDMFPLIAWFNERRVKDDSIKIRRVLRHKMEEGSMVIKAPYGYIKNGNQLTVDKVTAPVIREVFDLFLNGEGMSRIAAIMNDRGYPTPSQLKNQYAHLNQTCTWNKQHIARILKHRIYTGDMPYGMREKVSYKSKKYINKPKEDWIIINGHHEAIVSKEAFDAVQEKLGRYAQVKPRISGDKTFSGILFCARCGSRMHKIQRAALQPSYVCGKSHREGRIKDEPGKNDGCSPHRVYVADLAEMVKYYIKKLLTDEAFQTRLLQELDNTPTANSEISKQIQKCENKMAALKTKAAMIYEDKLNGTIPEYLFKQKLDAVNKELFTYEDRVKTYAQSRMALNGQPDTKHSIASIIKEIHKNNIHHDTVSMLFKKILVFNPNEITDGQRAEYGLSETAYESMKSDGGILFVQHCGYSCGLMVYEPVEGELFSSC